MSLGDVTDRSNCVYSDVHTSDQTAAGKTSTVYAVCITLNL